MEQKHWTSRFRNFCSLLSVIFLIVMNGHFGFVHWSLVILTHMNHTLVIISGLVKLIFSTQKSEDLGNINTS